MEEIVDSVKRVTDIMAEITSASAEQSSGIEQVTQTVTQMDEVTQQNASLVEEASAAARSMEEQAGTMENLVQQFRISEEAAREVKRRRQDAAGEYTGASQSGNGEKRSEVARAASQAKSNGNDFQVNRGASTRVARDKAASTRVNGHEPSSAAAASSGGDQDDSEQWTSF